MPGNYDDVRCPTCGVPWEQHTEAHCPFRHEHRPQWVKDAEAARNRTFRETLTVTHVNGKGANGVHPR